MNALRTERRRSVFTKPLLAIVLAGGRGSRLEVLTETRCKPELPFTKNRLVDFALANVVNSQCVNHVMLLTQYMQQGLIRHLQGFDLVSRGWDKSVNIYPAQQQSDDDSWYGGTANAVYQNRVYIEEDVTSDTVIILAADHICKLDARQMHTFHLECGSKFTVCGLVVPTSEAAGNFGVMELDEQSRIIGFEEKPKSPKSLPGREGECFASMGIYIVDKKLLLSALEEDHQDDTSEHDFGKNIIPLLIGKAAPIFGYDYNDNVIPGESQIINGEEVYVLYWRDVGRIGPYWEAVMDIVEVVPKLNLYNGQWLISTVWDMAPVAKFVTPDRSLVGRTIDTVLAGGCIVDNHVLLDRCAINRNVRIERGVEMREVVVFDRATVKRDAKLQNTIVEEGVTVPIGARVGFDIEEDRTNGVYIDRFHDPKMWYPPIRVVTKNAFRKS